jgi:hypothetical protein
MDKSGYVGPLCDLTPEQLEDAFGVSDLFTYEADFSGLASGATAIYQFNVQADSNFLWQRACFQADIADAAFTYQSQPIPNVTVLLTDTSSGRQLMSAPMPVPSLFGLGHAPADLINPRWFRANTQVTVSVTNYDAAVTYNLRLSFIGTKFFNYQG